jgi:uncharacterized protein (TIGR02996 family)
VSFVISSEQESLLANIIAKPDDDLPRLVYSDWLKDHGEEICSEFIRLQVTLASMKERTPERNRVRAQEIKAWEKLYTAWSKRFRSLCFYKKFFSRGFPCAMTGEQWPRRGVVTTYELFQSESPHWWPLLPIRWLYLTFDGQRLPTFESDEYLQRLVTFSCQDSRQVVCYPEERIHEQFDPANPTQQYRDQLVANLFQSTRFSCLETLELQGVPISQSVFDIVRRSSILNQLKRLELAYSAPWFPSFKWPDGRRVNGRWAPWECPLGEALDWFIEHLHEL